MRRAEVAAAIAAAVLALGCGDDEGSPPRFMPDPMAPVDLWPIRGAGGPIPDGGFAGAAAGMADPAAAFEPDAVYVVGMIGEKGCFAKAIFELGAPERALPGIDCAADERTAVIRPNPKRLVYLQQGTLRSFRCEGCAFTAVDAEFFPARAGDGDPVEQAGCARANDVIVGPGGEIALRCETLWRLPISGPFAGRAFGFDLSAFGPGDTALAPDKLIRAQGEPLPLTWPAMVRPQIRPHVVRLRSDGYWAVGESSQSTLAAGLASNLVHIAVDGTTALLGTYPAVPRDATPAVRASAVLDDDGRLVELFENGWVVRRSIDGESAIVYDPRAAPGFKPSALVTGP